MNKKLLRILSVLLLIFCVFIQSCKTLSGTSKADSGKSYSGKFVSEKTAVTSSADDFAKSIDEYILDNGITVYVKENHSNRLVSLALLRKGGVKEFTPEQSGFEMSLIRMLKSGSKKYAYSDIQDLKYKTHASFYGVATNEGSYFGIDCLDYYLDELLDVLADGLFNPLFDETEFNTMMKEHVQRLQRMQSDPSSLCYYAGLDAVYKNHPYETHPWPTEKSINNITIDRLKTLYNTYLDADKIAIVVTGNVKGKKIVKKLNEYFGAIPGLSNQSDKKSAEKPVEKPALEKNDIEKTEIAKLEIKEQQIVLSSPASEGTGFILGFFASPSVNEEDFMSAQIASDMFSDMLYQVVREKYGACYTPSCGAIWSNAAFGVINLYRVSNLEKIISYADEAQKLMEQGKLISGKDENDSFIFTTIDERLESYKNTFINRTYTEQKTVSGLCSKMVNSVFMFGNPYEGDSFAQKAREVTAESVEKAFKKYIADGKRLYVAVTAPGQESKVKF